jgi:hypothetical protein
MLHHIRTGPRPAATEEPIDLLMACHARLRHFSATALALSTRPDLDAPSVRDAAGQLARYFRLALPMHEADEEQSLAPALLATPAGAGAADALDAMTAQHRLIHEVLDELLPGWERLREEPDALDPDALAGPSRRLGAVLDVHLALEEAEIFPVVEIAIPVEERRRIHAAMRGRRTPEVFAAME